MCGIAFWDFLGRTLLRRTLFGRTLHTGTTERVKREPGDIIRARLGLGRTLPFREPGDIIRARLGLGRTFLDLLELSVFVWGVPPWRNFKCYHNDVT